MFLFLRRLRYRLLEEGRLGRYLGYACGEVVLVVAGILIALQLEEARQERENQKLVSSYLQNLARDLRLDIDRTGSWIDRFDRKIAGLELAKEYHFSREEPDDAIGFLRDISYGAVFSRGQLLGDSPTYEDLIGTGNLSLFASGEFKRELVLYYINKQFFRVYGGNLRTDFANYVNSTYPWNERDPDAIDPRDIERARVRFRDSAFLDLINLELTYAHSLDGNMRLQRADAEALLAKVEARLRKAP